MPEKISDEEKSMKTEKDVMQKIREVLKFLISEFGEQSKTNSNRGSSTFCVKSAWISLDY